MVGVVMIQVSHLTKRYGKKTAVDDLSFAAYPGVVTGFLGPNGASKTTTMRVILGLDAPTSATATVDDQPIAQRFGIATALLGDPASRRPSKE